MTLYDYDFDRLGGFIAIVPLGGDRVENLYFGPFQTLEDYRDWHESVFPGELPDQLAGVTPLIHPAAEFRRAKPFVEVASWNDIKAENTKSNLPFGVTQLLTSAADKKVPRESIVIRIFRRLFHL